MQIEKTTTLEVSAKATLRAGKVEISVLITAPYLDRSATAIFSDFPQDIQDQVAEALQAAVEYVINETSAVDQAGAIANEATVIAMSKGEV